VGVTKEQGIGSSTMTKALGWISVALLPLAMPFLIAAVQCAEPDADKVPMQVLAPALPATPSQDSVEPRPSAPSPPTAESPRRVEVVATADGTPFEKITWITSLGEAWRDPAGIVWGDILSSSDGTVVYMMQNEASALCEIVGARLPTKEEFMELRKFLGAFGVEMIAGYTPQILPNLNGHYFWTSSEIRGSDDVYIFNGTTGDLRTHYPFLRRKWIATRCVLSELPPDGGFTFSNGR
jgi:hypothetical protein